MPRTILTPTSVAATALLGVLAGPALPARAQAPLPGAAPSRRAAPVPGAIPVAPPADLPAEPFDVPAAATALTPHLSPARPTVFVFTKRSSSLERRFVQQVCRDAGRKVGVGVVSLSTGTEPVATKYAVRETPTALVFDRRGRFVTRSTDADEIRAAVAKAGGVMRINWPEGGDPRVEESERRLGRPVTGGILRTMTFQPEWLAHINDLATQSHFSPGFLDVRTKEMIATYVSALNHCKF
jgi:hypothetical protein